MVGVVGMPASYIARAASMDALCWQLEAVMVAGSLLRPWLLAISLLVPPHLGFSGGVGIVMKGDRVSPRSFLLQGLVGCVFPAFLGL